MPQRKQFKIINKNIKNLEKQNHEKKSFENEFAELAGLGVLLELIGGLEMYYREISVHGKAIYCLCTHHPTKTFGCSFNEKYLFIFLKQPNLQLVDNCTCSTIYFSQYINFPVCS
jgi:hypothetical protein